MLQNFDEKNQKDKVPKRLAHLRKLMKSYNLDGFIIPRSDFFQSEYVAECDERLAWLTGFTGSAGFSCVLQKNSAVFVDGRYRIQVKTQVIDEFEIVHWPETTLTQWIAKNIKSGTIGFDADLHTEQEIDEIKKTVDPSKIKFTAVENLIDIIWTNQPLKPKEAIFQHPLKFAGKSSKEKCLQISTLLKTSNQKNCVLTDPESIAWLLNIRGADVPRVPVVHSTAIINDLGNVDLFIDPIKLKNFSSKQLKHTTFCKPQSFNLHLKNLDGTTRVDPKKTPLSVVALLKKPMFSNDPCLLLKAKKNKIEISGTKKAHKRDATAMVEFLCWLDAQTPGMFTEIETVKKLEDLRRKIKYFKDISFETIAGSGPNGAMAHYRVTSRSNRKVENGDLLLVDSGGQYLDGTTDITRTIPVGSVSKEKKHLFTRVLKGMIAISKLRFPSGTSGRDIDAIARIPLWEIGQDYNHGTGHGVGSYLSVHEGPQRISKASATALAEGMIVSNEPGFYLENNFGIRIENLLIVKKSLSKNKYMGKEMLEFETITMVPIDKRLIIKKLLDAKEIKWINSYHKKIQTEVRVEGKALNWLRKATSPL
jgi:Xaa-Pro aminopeptidase